MFQANQQIGGYMLIKQVGRGGFGRENKFKKMLK